jgi:hypothetical protein
LNRSREGGTKTGEVCAAVDRVDVVGERIDLLVVAIVVLNGHFDRERVGFLFEVERLVVKRRLVLVQVFDKFRDTAFVVKLVRAFGIFPLILDRDPDALVEKRLFSESLGKLVETENCVIENLAVWFERDLRAAFSVLPVWAKRATAIPRT